MKINQFVILSTLLLTFGCANSEISQPNKPENVQREKVVVTNTNNENVKKEEVKTEKEVADKVETEKNVTCADVQKDGYKLDQKQTFAIDFKPFEKSCFVTFHDPQFTNPPLGSQYFIYKNGKEVYAFPDQFNGGNATCWVESVAFEDVNEDALEDVIVVGKCGAKAEAYNENMVYINSGKDFITNIEGNSELLDFSKVSQIKDFVKKNKPMFY
jgi:DNA-directed RNA polymerase subunit M/transcription elongation factor TFIIS